VLPKENIEVKTMRLSPILAVIALGLLVACSPNQVSVTATTPLSDTPTQIILPTATETVTLPAPTNTIAPTEISVSEVRANAAPDYNGPAWTRLPLTNARTGETFTLADFAGKTVFVEPMATWCPKCRDQQNSLRTAIEQLGTDRYVYISLQVEMDVSNTALAEYADGNGFGWIFAVTTPELLEALVTHYSHSIGVPPSTPHFVIAPDGTTSELYTGQQWSGALVELLQAVSGT
jgi:hypothetical protein